MPALLSVGVSPLIGNASVPVILLSAGLYFDGCFHIIILSFCNCHLDVPPLQASLAWLLLTHRYHLLLHNLVVSLHLVYPIVFPSLTTVSLSLSVLVLDVYVYCPLRCWVCLDLVRTL